MGTNFKKYKCKNINVKKYKCKGHECNQTRW